MSNSGNSSWQPIRRRPRGCTKGYDSARHGEEVGSAQDRRIVSFVFQVTELECVSSQTTAIKSQKTELNQTIEELEAALRSKEEVRGDEGNGPPYPNIHRLCICFRNYRNSKLKWRVPTGSRLRKTRSRSNCRRGKRARELAVAFRLFQP